MLTSQYADLFLLDHLMSLVKGNFPVAPKLRKHLAWLSSFKTLTSEEQIRCLNETIFQLSNSDAEEVIPPAVNNAIFDCYFRIRRVNSPHIEVAIRSVLIVLRNAILNGQRNRHQVSDEEWKNIIGTSLLIVEKIGGFSMEKKGVEANE